MEFIQISKKTSLVGQDFLDSDGSMNDLCMKVYIIELKREAATTKKYFLCNFLCISVQIRKLSSLGSKFRDNLRYSFYK